MCEKCGKLFKSNPLTFSHIFFLLLKVENFVDEHTRLVCSSTKVKTFLQIAHDVI